MVISAWANSTGGAVNHSPRELYPMPLLMSTVNPEDTAVATVPYSSVAVWQCGSAAVRQCRSAVVRQFGSAAVWQYGSSVENRN